MSEKPNCTGVMRATCAAVGKCLFPDTACLSSPHAAANDVPARTRELPTPTHPKDHHHAD